MILFYEYAKCSTCVKARKWLEARKVKFSAIPIVEKPPTAGELRDYFAKAGLELKKFFNTSGLSYREGKVGEKLPTLSHKEAFAMLAADGKLIKRPLLISSAPGGDGSTVLVGFDENKYAAHFG